MKAFLRCYRNKLVDLSPPSILKTNKKKVCHLKVLDKKASIRYMFGLKLTFQNFFIRIFLMITIIRSKPTSLCQVFCESNVFFIVFKSIGGAHNTFLRGALIIVG